MHPPIGLFALFLRKMSAVTKFHVLQGLFQESKQFTLHSRRLARAVRALGHNHHVKVLVRPNQPVRQSHCRRQIDVVIQAADAEHQRVHELVRVCDVGAALVARVDGVAHEDFAPQKDAEAVVVAAGARHGGLVKVGVVDHGGGGVVAAGRVAVAADTGEVHRGPRPGGCADPAHAVGEPGVDYVFLAHVVEALGASVCAHAVGADHNVSLVSKDPEVRRGSKGLGRVEILRTSVYEINDGITLCLVKIFGVY